MAFAILTHACVGLAIAFMAIQWPQGFEAAPVRWILSTLGKVIPAVRNAGLCSSIPEIRAAIVGTLAVTGHLWIVTQVAMVILSRIPLEGDLGWKDLKDWLLGTTVAALLYVYAYIGFGFPSRQYLNLACDAKIGFMFATYLGVTFVAGYLSVFAFGPVVAYYFRKRQQAV